MGNATDLTAKRDAARRTALEVARRMLDGKISLIEGCRNVVQLSRDAEIPPSEALDTFIAVESETDDYPVGSVRSEYAPQLLERLDTQVSRYLTEERPGIIKACREIIREIEDLLWQSYDPNRLQ
jgi:hypothetical protein